MFPQPKQFFLISGFSEIVQLLRKWFSEMQLVCIYPQALQAFEKIIFHPVPRTSNLPEVLERYQVGEPLFSPINNEFAKCAVIIIIISDHIWRIK